MAKRESGSIMTYLFTMLLLQGISFILLGLLIWVYPPLLIALAVIAFLWIGITTIITAFRIRNFRREFLGDEPRPGTAI